MIVLSAMSLNLVSCFDAVENEYRVTVPTFATVTKNEAGKVRLYLDENRGILTPHEKSEAINWGELATIVEACYDVPLQAITSVGKYAEYSGIRCRKHQESMVW